MPPCRRADVESGRSTLNFYQIFIYYIIVTSIKLFFNGKERKERLGKKKDRLVQIYIIIYNRDNETFTRKLTIFEERFVQLETAGSLRVTRNANS